MTKQEYEANRREYAEAVRVIDACKTQLYNDCKQNPPGTERSQRSQIESALDSLGTAKNRLRACVDNIEERFGQILDEDKNEDSEPGSDKDKAHIKKLWEKLHDEAADLINIAIRLESIQKRCQL